MRLAQHATLSLALILLAGCGQTPHTVAEKYYLVVPNVKSPYWDQVSGGLNQAARELKVYAALVGPDSYDPQAQKQEFKRIAGFEAGGHPRLRRRSQGTDGGH